MVIQLTAEEIQELIQNARPRREARRPEDATREESIRKVDLAQVNEKISRGRLPGLELVFERLARQVRSSLERTLGRSVSVSVAAIETMKFGAFIKRLPLPASLHIFRAPPLTGKALLYLSSPLAYSFVELLMGGNLLKHRKAKTAGREFTALESRLLANVVLQLLGDFDVAWASICPQQSVFVSSEQNPLAVSIVPATENVLVATLDIDLEVPETCLQFCLPSSLLAPVLEKLQSGLSTLHEHRDEQSKKRIEKQILGATVELRAMLGTGRLKIKDILELKVGDIVPLEALASDPAALLVEGVKKFSGDLGTERVQKALKIRQIF